MLWTTEFGFKAQFFFFWSLFGVKKKKKKKKNLNFGFNFLEDVM